MSRFTRFIRRRGPGSLSYALTWLGHHLTPNVRHRREARIWRELGSPRTVLQGPFQGMQYDLLAGASSVLLPKLLGTYEMELWPAVDRLIDLQPDVVVDVGSAEGWYVIGLARRLPQTRVLAYDVSRWANFLARRMAARNRVADRLKLCGWCSTQELERALVPATRPAFICDCEGYELELLEPDKVPSLRKTTILVELHDMLHPGLTEEIRRRMESTHDIAEIHTRQRTPSDLPKRVSLSSNDASWAMDEARGGAMSWFFLTPRSR